MPKSLPILIPVSIFLGCATAVADGWVRNAVEEPQSAMIDKCAVEAALPDDLSKVLIAACPVAAEVIPCAARTAGKMVSEDVLSATSKDTLLQCLSDAAEPVST